VRQAFDDVVSEAEAKRPTRTAGTVRDLRRDGIAAARRADRVLGARRDSKIALDLPELR